uniref:Uncharacterized protein n=1 Tax=Caenorhabditis japonica TaxID=281687 RepID=A0A8R1INW5_CAEJA
MRTPTKIVARSSQIGPNTRAMPSSASRQPPPHPLVTGTAVNHDEILYVLRKTQRKPISPSIVQRQQRASRQQTIHPKPPGTETTIQSDHRETRKTTTPPQKDHTLGLGRPDLQSINVKDQGRSGEKGGSPDLNPMDFSVWGMLEGKIAGKVFATVDDLKAALEVAWASIDDGYLRRTVNSVKKRLRACVKARGSNFEILL